MERLQRLLVFVVISLLCSVVAHWSVVKMVFLYIVQVFILYLCVIILCLCIKHLRFFFFLLWHLSSSIDPFFFTFCPTKCVRVCVCVWEPIVDVKGLYYPNCFHLISSRTACFLAFRALLLFDTNMMSQIANPTWAILAIVTKCDSFIYIIHSFSIRLS